MKEKLVLLYVPYLHYTQMYNNTCKNGGNDLFFFACFILLNQKSSNYFAILRIHLQSSDLIIFDSFHHHFLFLF